MPFARQLEATRVPLIAGSPTRLVEDLAARCIRNSGLFSEDRASNFSRVFFSPGMHYLITPIWEVGLRLGWRLTEQSSPFVSHVRLGLRF